MFYMKLLMDDVNPGKLQVCFLLSYYAFFSCISHGWVSDLFQQVHKRGRPWPVQRRPHFPAAPGKMRRQLSDRDLGVEHCRA